MWHLRTILIARAGILLLLVPGVQADSLQLKNGNFVQGKYLGGTERAVQFEANGKIRLYDIGEILSISFAAASADGGIPSNDVDTKPSANTELSSAAKDHRGSRAVLWNQAKTTKYPGQQITQTERQYSSRVKLLSGRPAGRLQPGCAVVAANSEAKARVSAIPTQPRRILAWQFPVLSD